LGNSQNVRNLIVDSICHETHLSNYDYRKLTVYFLLNGFGLLFT